MALCGRVCDAELLAAALFDGAWAGLLGGPSATSSENSVIFPPTEAARKACRRELSLSSFVHDMLGWTMQVKNVNDEATALMLNLYNSSQRPQTAIGPTWGNRGNGVI